MCKRRIKSWRLSLELFGRPVTNDAVIDNPRHERSPRNGWGEWMALDMSDQRADATPSSCSQSTLVQRSRCSSQVNWSTLRCNQRRASYAFKKYACLALAL